MERLDAVGRLTRHNGLAGSGKREAVYLTGHPRGAVVAVWVVPGASRDEIVGGHGDALRIRVAAPPEGGRANDAVVRLLEDRFPGHRAVLLRGASSRRKRVLIEGVAPGEARSTLGAS